MPTYSQRKQLACLATLFDGLATDAEDPTDFLRTQGPAVFLNELVFGLVSSNECRSEWLDCLQILYDWAHQEALYENVQVTW